MNQESKKAVIAGAITGVPAMLILTTQLAAQTQGASSGRAEAFILGVILFAAWMLSLSALVVWFKRSGVKISGSDESEIPSGPMPEWLSRPASRRPVRATTRVRPAKAKAASPTAAPDAPSTSDVLSQLNKIVENTRDDIRYYPVFSLNSIPLPPERLPLPSVRDAELIATTLDACDELQSDPDIRKQAMEKLAGHPTRESVEALSQAAIYDLLASHRCHALAMLTTIDHGSTFEAMVVACADPSREVRAAASRALAKVTFSRADEWFRIALAEDTYQVRKCASALISAGMIDATFSRLTNRHRTSVLEAVGMISVLIRAGEYDEIIDTIINGPDLKVAKALLHVVEINADPALARELQIAAETFEIHPDLCAHLDRITKKLTHTPNDPNAGPLDFTHDRTTENLLSDLVS